MDDIIKGLFIIFFTVLFFVLLGTIPANIAEKKGRNIAKWWLYGFTLFPIAIIHCLFLKDSRTR